jgi:hypothetical protein
MSHPKADDFSLQTELSAERDSRDLGAWRRGVRRLDIDRPPEGVPCDRWRTFVAAAARFLAGPKANCSNQRSEHMTTTSFLTSLSL